MIPVAPVLAQFIVDQTLVPRLEVSLWIVSVAAILAAVGFWIWRRVKAKKGQVRELAPGTLRRIWKSFIRQIPSEFRRHVLFFQPFVVFGEAASGKSLLISKYTDWKGQAAQFYPSYSVDPALQIYLGSRALVQEIPATLLADTSQKARAALVNLWSPLFKKRDPIVVVALSAAALRTATAEALRTQAQMLRGKLNVLSRLVDKPVQVRVVLTHMDQVEGYLAFADFVEKNGIPYQLKIDPKSPNAGLATCLEPIETYLSNALVTLPAKGYLKVLTFLNKAPETFQHLGVFVSTLTEADPLSFEPEVKDLYLTSDTSGSPSAVVNPFASSWAHQTMAIERAILARHRLITRAIAAVALLYFGAGFLHERSRLADAREKLDDFETACASGQATGQAADAAKAIAAFADGTDAPIAHVLLPQFFKASPALLRGRFVGQIRSHYLLPKLKEFKTQPNASERLLYLIALVRSSRDDALGRYVSLRTKEWAAVLDVPEPVVATYVQESSAPWNEALPAVGSLPYERKIIAATQLDPWHSFLLELERLLDRRTMSPDELAKLQKDAAELKGGIDAVLRKNTARDVHEILRQNPNFDAAPFAELMKDTQTPPWLITNLQAFEGLLDLVRSSTLDVAPISKGNLNEVVYRLKGLQAVSIPESARIVVDLDTRKYAYDVAAWHAVVNNGKARIVAQQFIRANQSSGLQIFFANAANHSDVAMRPATNSEFLFSGTGIVSGVYTRAAYERVVRPQLDAFEGVWKSLEPKPEDAKSNRLTLEPDVHKELATLVENAAIQYATEYSNQWKKFYRSWRVQADSLGSLKIVLGQMKLPSSRFQEFLDRVRENTQYDAATSQLGNVLYDRLSEFRPINQISAITSGSLTELEKFRRILGRIQADLDGQSPDAPPPEEAAKNRELVQKGQADFEQILTPVAQLAYAILMERRDSYLILTQQWLKAAGIVDEWRAPFLEPIDAVYKLGRADLQEIVKRGWEKRVVPEILPLLEKFPFNQNAVVDATPQEVHNTLFPSTGKYWKAFRQFIAPVLVEGSEWRPVKGLETNFEFPKGMFEVANHLSTLTTALWDKDTNPRPISVGVKPEPLPKGKNDKPQVILSFINVGTSSVFGFNQKPYWQTLNVQWWTRPTAEVGLMVGDPENERDKAHRQLVEPESAWSFYRLLLKDRQAELNVYTFNLTQGEPEYPAPLLKFTFKEDPWAIFRVPSVKQQQEKTGP